NIARARDGDIYVAAAFADDKLIGGELHERGGRSRCRLQRTEQSVLFFRSSGREIECVWIAAATTVTKYKRPQFVIYDVVDGLILERTKKRPGKRGVDINDSVVVIVADE